MKAVLPVYPPLRTRRPRTRTLSALLALFWLTLRQHMHGRRALVLLALFALPAGLAVLLRCLADPGPPLEALEFAFLGNLIPHALAPLTALLYGSGMIQDEVEEQTLTYLLLRPLPRWALYLTRFLATLLTTTVLVAVGALAVEVAVYAGTPEWGAVLAERLPKMVGALALAQVGYVALFGGLAMLTRRSLLAGVAYIALVEGVLGNIDFLLRKLTVVYHFRVLAVNWLELPQRARQEWLRGWQLDPEKLPLAQDSVWALLAAAGVIVAMSVWSFSRSEYPLKTPEGS
jgi:ABC-2 type transport system permease protein